MNNFVTAITRSSKTLRILFLLLCSAAAVGGLGCMTGAALSHRAPRWSSPPRELYADKIFATALLDAKTRKQLGTDDAIAFLGQRATYLIVSGGMQITNIAAQLDGDRLEIASKHGGLFIKDEAVWGSLWIGYKMPENGAFSDEEVRRLKDLHFKREADGSYSMTIPVHGAVREPLKLPDNQIEHIQRTREIVFYSPPKSYQPPDVAKLVLVPLGVAADIVLLPVYFGMIVVILN